MRKIGSTSFRYIPILHAFTSRNQSAGPRAAAGASLIRTLVAQSRRSTQPRRTVECGNFGHKALGQCVPMVLWHVFVAGPSTRAKAKRRRGPACSRHCTQHGYLQRISHRSVPGAYLLTYIVCQLFLTRYLACRKVTIPLRLAALRALHLPPSRYSRSRAGDSFTNVQGKRRNKVASARPPVRLELAFGTG